MQVAEPSLPGQPGGGCLGTTCPCCPHSCGAIRTGSSWVGPQLPLLIASPILAFQGSVLTAAKALPHPTLGVQLLRLPLHTPPPHHPAHWECS